VKRAIVLALLLIAACSGKKKSGAVEPSQVTGLGAVPGSARVVIGVSPARLATSDVVVRAFLRLLERDADLAMRVDRLAEGCHIAGSEVESLHLVLSDTAPQPLLIATGPFSEADLAKCVQTTVGAGGGSMTVEQDAGRTLYHVVDGQHSMWFSFGQRDTVVLSGARELVIESLGDGPRVLDQPEMRALIERADTRAPVWAVGRVDDQLGQRLLRLTRGQVQSPPRAFLGRLDPTDGLQAELTAVAASEADAKVLESKVEPMLSLAAMAAQARGMGPLFGNVSVRQERDAVRIGITLTDAELKDVLSKVDSSPPPEQDAGPSHGP
jgi:hypothetical protein